MAERPRFRGDSDNPYPSWPVETGADGGPTGLGEPWASQLRPVYGASMQTPRELWTISEWFSNAGWGMYIIGVGAGVALPWNILSAFRPGPRSRRAAIVLTLLTVAGGIGMWFWGIHQMETAIVTLTPEQQQEVRVQGYLEARGLLEAVAVVAVLGLLAQILGLFTQLVLGRDERQFQRRGAPWHPLGFACSPGSFFSRRRRSCLATPRVSRRRRLSTAFAWPSSNWCWERASS